MDRVKKKNVGRRVRKLIKVVKLGPIILPPPTSLMILACLASPVKKRVSIELLNIIVIKLEIFEVV